MNSLLIEYSKAPLKLGVVAGIMLLGGCASLNNSSGYGAKMPENLSDKIPQTDLFASIPKEKLNSATRQLAAEGVKALDAKDYRKASEIFNLAVKTEITNSYLHFMNGVAYQFRAIAGESALIPLAEQGYQMAIRFDNSNWLARYYGGLLDLHQGNYAAAQSKFAEAALYVPNHPDVLYDLAYASYYNHDPKTSAAALAGLRELQGSTVDPLVLRASAIVSASLGQPEDAENFVDQLRRSNARKEDVSKAAMRVASWQQSHERGRLLKANYLGFVDPITGQQDYAQPVNVAPVGFTENNMAAVDVIILSTEEDNTDAMGVNLLDGLKIQFGNPNTLTPAFTKSFSSTVDNNNPDPTTSFTNSSTSSITRMIGMSAVSYSLNIANANTKRSEVIARPTLVALGNQTSTFFSGTDINAAAVSNGQGSAIQVSKEVGVKLAVTPEFLPGNLIKLNINAERTFLATPSNSVVYDFRLDTTKTMVNANVIMKYGETLILSGLSERDLSTDRDGVPILQDIPIVQYLFSRKVNRDYYKSVLIMLTPRKAQYTNRSEQDVASERSLLSPSDLTLAEFEDKYKPWFKPIPNIGEITQRLEGSSLYREFRTGDLEGMSWQSSDNHVGRLKNALNFIFY